MQNRQRIATEPIDLVQSLVAEINRLGEANETTHLLAHAPALNLSDPLKAQIALLDELIQSLKLKVNALKR